MKRYAFCSKILEDTRIRKHAYSTLFETKGMRPSGYEKKLRVRGSRLLFRLRVWRAGDFTAGGGGPEVKSQISDFKSRKYEKNAKKIKDSIILSVNDSSPAPLEI